MKKRLTISDIAAMVLGEDSRSGFLSNDKVLLRKVFDRCVDRKVMKNTENNWCDRVLSGIEYSHGFEVVKHGNLRMFKLREFKIFGL